MTAREIRQHARAATRRAFTLVEVLVVVVILGILASMAIAQFSGSQEDAKATGTMSSLASVRAGIASFAERAVIAGNDQFPTLAELTTTGTVIDRAIPPNPYTSISGVRAATAVEAGALSVVSADTFGWNYYVNNAGSPPQAVIWANSDAVTTEPDGAGGVLTANQM